MKLKNVFKDYFYYTASEARGALVLLLLLLLIAALRFAVRPAPKGEPIDDKAFEEKARAFAAVVLENEDNYWAEKSQTGAIAAGEPFYFDPNTATVEDFQRLGLSPKTAQSIANYRNKGGRFYKATDFQKIYTLKKEDFERLLPFIRMEERGDRRDFAKAERETDAAKRTVEYFDFDPNAATVEDFQRLGLSQKTAQSILNYREKGGQFRKAEDFKKIYALRAEDFERLLPYIKIPEKTPTTVAAAKPAEREVPTEYNYVKKSATAIIDLNTAKVENLQQLKGIGEGFAKRIVEYRDKLGGFVETAQLKEVYGISETLLEQIAPQLSLKNREIRQLNINTAEAETLKSHPYLDWKTANSIVKYRKQHGAFKTVDDLQKIYSLPKTTFERIKPYLTI